MLHCAACPWLQVLKQQERAREDTEAGGREGLRQPLLSSTTQGWDPREEQDLDVSQLLGFRACGCLGFRVLA